MDKFRTGQPLRVVLPRHCLRWLGTFRGRNSSFQGGGALEAFCRGLELPRQFICKISLFPWAIGCYQEAIKLEPDSAQAWWGLGGSYARSGNRKAALEAVRELRKYDPQGADQLLNLINKPKDTPIITHVNILQGRIGWSIEGKYQ